MESITPLLTGLLPDNSFLHEAKQTGNQPSARSTNSATLNKHPHPESSKGLSGSPSFAKHSVNDSYQGAEIYILFEKAYLKTRKTIPDGWCHPWLWTVCNVQKPSKVALWLMTCQITQHPPALWLNPSSRSCEHCWCPWHHRLARISQ